MTQKDLQKIFDSFSKVRVLIIGDAMVDAYIWGIVNRISPEAPVPIVAVKTKETRLGGAANVALNVQAMGATPILCSMIGDDMYGREFTDLMEKQKLSTQAIFKSKKRVTTVKTRIIGNNHHLLRVDEEVESEISKTETQQMIEKISFLIKTNAVDVIVFEDYDKGVITPELIQKVVVEATKKKIPVAVDPKKKNFQYYKNITLFKPNLKELKDGIKSDLNLAGLEILSKVADELRVKQGMENILITLSEKGMFIATKKIKRIVPAHIRNVADVSGAGDTVIGVAALGLALKLDPVLMVELANLAGGLVCEKVGVVPIDKELLFQESIRLLIK
ncbi:MAG: D-glycero-beta-D-manno-heptose-7-phosphate kinase [Bacteroidetes bacterium]|nr:D-glycero-beta-D-manno-heptose-7-phosphate kinase [Bacteroidota bacterium]